MADVQAGLGIINERFRIMEQASQALCKVQVNTQAWHDYLKAIGIMPTREPSQELGQRRMSTRAQNIINEVTGLFEHGKGQRMDGVKGTAWAAFNAIVEYVDYTRTTKGEDQAASRASSLLFGSGATLKQKAWDSAMALVPK